MAQDVLHNSEEVSARSLQGLRIYDCHGKAIGKVKDVLFHPKKRRCVGLSIKRPDAALMFKRKDLLLTFRELSIQDGNLTFDNDSIVSDEMGKGSSYPKLEECLIWQGMSVVSEDGEKVGTIADVMVSMPSGKVNQVKVSGGLFPQMLEGSLWIPRKMICGFRWGVGDALASGSLLLDQDRRGAIVVSNAVYDLGLEGGLSEAAGKAVSVASHEARAVTENATENIRRMRSSAAPKMNKAAGKMDDALAAGAFSVGRQIGRTKGMFASFKSEYDKAVFDESQQEGLRDEE